MLLFNVLFISSTPTLVMLTEHDPHELASVRASLEDIRLSVQAAHGTLDAGLRVDLSGMDERMQQLCKRALALPSPQAQETLPDLEALLGSVDGLIETLTSRRGR